MLTLKVIGSQWYWTVEVSSRIKFSSYSRSIFIDAVELRPGQKRLLKTDQQYIFDTYRYRIITTGEDVIHS